MNKLTENKVFGFVSAKDKTVVNGRGEEILFRGVGFGSWFLPEGYMWCFPEEADRPRRMEKMIRDLVGDVKADEFWDIYYKEYITENDIRVISEEGYNSVRIPINYRNFKENSNIIKHIDNAIKWCTKYNIYIILDLHGAPGGQTGTNIDDSENDSPELFIKDSNIKLMIDFWKEIAKRYKDQWIIAGYDLLNEPLPEWFSKYNHKVLPLYKKIIKVIREIDTKHMIILEGVHWATDWSIFTEKLDDNIMLQFHKYWNNPDKESLTPYLKKRDELNVPIFMGEGGENNCNWYTGAFRLFEDLDISWNFWTWKKMFTTNSPFSIKKPLEWDLLIDYLIGGKKPNREKSISILWEFLNNIKICNCFYRPDVSRSILSVTPLTIPAIFYSFKDEGIGFNINKNNNLRSIGYRVNDGISMGFTTGNREITNFQHGGGEDWKDDEWAYIELNKEEWVSYNFYVDKKNENKIHNISIRAKSESDNVRIKLSLDNQIFPAYYEVTPVWKDIKSSISFTAFQGLNNITLFVINGKVKIEKINIELNS
ncbi:MAG: glycoside hydrolase family 5 protein [Spirochaetaceae bacterium]